MATSKIRWTKVNDSGLIPRPRHGHRAVAVQELMIVFGGGNEGIVDELHAYNTVSNQWFCPVVKGDIPPGCAAFGLAADNTRLIFHAGMVEYGNYSDSLYELEVGPYFTSGNNISSKWEWKKLKPKAPRFAQSPSPRLGHSFTFINGKFFLFGGLCKETDADGGKEMGIKYSNELYVLEFRGQSCCWEMPHTFGTPPCPRESHTAVGHIDSLGNPKLLVYGGMAGIRLGDIFALDLNSMTWTEIDVDGPQPLPRSLHSSSVVGDKMYVFGGWVPINGDDELYDQKWNCTSSVARLNLNTYKWEDIVIDYPDGFPRPRAGHCAVVVGNRIYIWSGRDGYTRAWDVQVCCKDLWFLEVDKPNPPGKVHLVKAGTKMLELNLPEVEFCDHYILQIMPYSIPVSPKAKQVTPKKKRKLPAPELDWVEEDIGPMLPPTSPLPAVPPPAKQETFPPISFPGEFLLPTQKPLIHGAPKSLARQTPVIVPPPNVAPSQNFVRTTLHHQHQPFVQNHNIVRSCAPTPLPPSTVQYVPIQEFAQLPKPDIRMNQLGKFVTPPFSAPQPMYPTTINMTQMTPVKTIPQQAKVLKVVNQNMGSFPNIKFQQPQGCSPHGQPPPKHTIIINKPNKQQIVVVSSAPAHSPQNFQPIQTMARPDSSLLSSNVQGTCNGVKQARLLPPAPTRVQVQNPSPMYKNVKLEINGKSLTVMVPCSAAATPNTQTKFVQKTNIHQTVVTNSCQPKLSVCQAGSVYKTVHPVKVLSGSCFNSNKINAAEEVVTLPQKLDGTKDGRTKIIGQPVPSSSGIPSDAISGNATSKSSDPNQLDLPEPPSNIKISKTPDGAIISWCPPTKGNPTGYSVNLGIKAENNNHKIAFINVYTDVHTKTKIPQDVLDKATLYFPKPTIIFRVSARNEFGYGPATQVRWLQDMQTC